MTLPSISPVFSLYYYQNSKNFLKLENFRFSTVATPSGIYSPLVGITLILGEASIRIRDWLLRDILYGKCVKSVTERGLLDEWACWQGGIE